MIGFTTFDLKSGYHHIIDIYKDFWPHLGKEGISMCYKCFLSVWQQPAIFFQRCLRRSVGIKMVLYLDSGLCTADSESTTERHTNQIMDNLKACSLVVNYRKPNLKH